MPVIKEQSGYTRASISAQALGGVVPVIDLNKKGDLQRLFASKAPAPFTDTPSAKTASLNDTAPRNNAQQPTQQQTAAQKDTPQQPEPTQAAEQQEPIHMQAMADNSPQNNMQAPQPPADAPSARFAFVPTQFTPVLSAGVLSALQHDTAEGPDGYKQGDEFKFGSAAGRHPRRVLERIENNMEADREEGRTDDRTLMMQYAAEQQRQQFIRSTEYAAAMQTVDRNIRVQEQRMEVLRQDEQALSQRMELHDQRIETLGQEITATEDRSEQLQGAINDRNEFNHSVAVFNNVNADQQKLDDELRSLPTIKMFKGEKGDYFQTIENGKEVTYLSGPDGEMKPISDEDLFLDSCERPIATYLKSNPDGSVSFIDDRGRPLTQDKADKLNTFMAKTEKTSANLGDMDDFEKRKAARDQHEKDKYMPALEQAAANETKLASSMQKLGIPMDQANNLEKHLEENQKGLEDLKAELAKELDDKKLTEKELAAKKAEIADVQKRYDENKAFKERLTKGEFKTEKEMLEAMPGGIKEQYEDGKKQALSAEAKTQPAQDNTSRANGSAAATYEGAANNGTISGKFQSAATNTPEATPEAPAPAPTQDDDMEYAAARQQPKPQAAGMAL